MTTRLFIPQSGNPSGSKQRGQNARAGDSTAKAARRKRSEAAKAQEFKGNQHSKPSEKVQVRQHSDAAPAQKARATETPDRKAKAEVSKTNQGAK